MTTEEEFVEEGMRLLAKRDESIDRLIETLDEETAKRIVGPTWCIPTVRIEFEFENVDPEVFRLITGKTVEEWQEEA